MFDLLIGGGHVIDPRTGIDRVLDVAVSGGQITNIAPDIPPADGDRVLDAQRKFVVPGLIDIHAHVFWGVTTFGMWPDDVCLRGGVTTVVDGGSSGPESFRGFHRWVVEGSQARVYAFVNVSRLGLIGIQAAGELLNNAYFDPDGVSRVIAEYPDRVLAIKIRTSRDIVGGPALPLLQAAKAVGSAAARPLHVHIGDTLEPLAELLAVLGPGDMVTHAETPKRHGPLGDDGRIIPELWDARERGVLFDCGHGRTNFSLDVAERSLQQGFAPDTISSDMSHSSLPQLDPGLLTVMNKWLAIGMTVHDVIKATTSAAAAAVGLGATAGSLAVGRAADIAVLELETGDFTYDDPVGATRSCRRRLVPSATVLGGRVAWEADTRAAAV